MDPLNILFPVRPDSRGTARALRDMGIRAVITPDGLELVSCSSPGRGIGSQYVVGGRFQPRDQFGQFVAYWVLSLEIETDLSDIAEHYSSEWLDELPDND